MATENGWRASAAQFRPDGFALVGPFLAEFEATALQNAVRELIKAGKLHSAATDFDRETRRDDKINLRICPLCYRHPFFAALPFHDRVQDFFTTLLGGPADKIPDQIFCKPGPVEFGLLPQ